MFSQSNEQLLASKDLGFWFVSALTLMTNRDFQVKKNFFVKSFSIVLKIIDHEVQFYQLVNKILAKDHPLSCKIIPVSTILQTG